MAYTYGIPDGSYTGKPVTASCYEKDGRLILDINFAVKDPNTGAWYKKENGYDWEVKKRHWLTSTDGAFNEKTINGLKEWAKGWNPTSLDDFWWFQNPDENGTPFGNLAAIGEVELDFQTDGQGNQNIWVHDPDRPRTGGHKAWTPPEANTDRAQMMAKWGTRAKALFAATPKKVAAGTSAQAATKPAQAAPAAGGGVAPSRRAAVSAAPSRPAGGAPKKANPWDEFPKTCDGAFQYFCDLLGEPYSGAKHDEKWFELFDAAAAGKDPDEFTQMDVERLFLMIRDGMAK